MQFVEQDDLFSAVERLQKESSVFKKVKRRAKEDRRVQILEIVLRNLRQSDYQMISTAKIAAEAGISEAAIYRNFRNKGEIYQCVIDCIRGQVQKIRERVALADVSKKKRLMLFVAGLIELVDRNPGYARILLCEDELLENLRLRERMTALLREIEREIARQYEALLESGAMLSVLSSTTLADIAMNFVVGRWYKTLHQHFAKRAKVDHHVLFFVLFGQEGE